MLFVNKNGVALLECVKQKLEEIPDITLNSKY